MRALVLGGTGHIGQAVVRELLAHRYRVTVATRQHAPRALDGLDVRVVHGERPDAWIDGHDVVIDAAAPAPLGVVADERAAVERTRGLLDGIERSGAALVFVSTFTTLPRTDSGVEAAWRRSLYPYFRVKETMERMVLDAARGGLPVAVVNPAACLGPWEHDTNRSLVHMILTQRLPAVMHQTLNVIDVRDVAAAVRAAFETRRFAVPIPLSGHNVELHDLSRRIAQLGGVPAPAFLADARVAQVAAFWTETMFGVVPQAMRAVPLIADAFPMETSPEQRALGIRPRSLETTLRDAVRWHRRR